MKWIKQIVIDLLATVVIALAVFYPNVTLEWVVYIYTGLMATARLFSLFSPNFQAITQRKISDAPVWVHHLLYALNVGILAFGEWFITAAVWVFIWAVASYVHQRSKKL